MARSIRFTVRLSEQEFGAMTDFANSRHIIPSVALRELIAQGVGPENRERGWIAGRLARLIPGKHWGPEVG